MRIRCAECADFDLCLECFSVGVEIDDHRARHAYRVIDKMNFELVEEGWTAWEELLLLEAIELYGYGNWYHAADHIGTKDHTQAQAHFEEMYLKQPGQVPQVGNIAPSGTSMERFLVSKADGTAPHLDAKLDSSSSLAGGTEDSGNDGNGDAESGASGGSSRGSKKSKSGSSGEASKRPRGRASHAAATPAEMAGYYELRDDFETEFDNDAEQKVMGMKFDDDDRDPVEHELFLAMLQIYNSKLEERKLRKEFVRQHDLTNHRKMQTEERKRAKDGEKEIFDQLRVFRRFLTDAEHDQLFQGLLREAAIRERIAELQAFRRAGITSLAEGEAYLEARHRRESGPRSGRSSSRRAPLSSAGAGPSLASSASLSLDFPGMLSSGMRAVRTVPSLAPSSSTDGDVPPEPPINVYRYFGVHSLSLAERDLAAAIHMDPYLFLHAKVRLMEASSSVAGIFTYEQACRVLDGVEAYRVKVLYDFCRVGGWFGDR